MMKKIGIVRFPGTNCDRDVWQAIEEAGLEPMWWWHEDLYSSKDVAGLIVPGGFSYGDYLRAGALSSRSRVMDSVRDAAQRGIPVLGICNGFQILCEAGLLPGALLRNENLRFIDKWVDLKLESPTSRWGEVFETRTVRLPIAHGEGRYFLAEEELGRLFDNNQVWWSYADNPNGSVRNIAGLQNVEGNVAALMPHPERAIFSWMGGEDGQAFFEVFK